MDETIDRGRLSRRLLRAQSHAALATSLADGDGVRPYASLVAVACDMDASPLLLISDLAQHSRNIAGDRRVSLLIDGGGTPTGSDPLAESRLSLLGEAIRCDDTRCLARFVARHPRAAQYAGFGDFHLYRVEIARGHLVAGFGRISWVERDELRLVGVAEDLLAAEAGIIVRMNARDDETSPFSIETLPYLVARHLHRPERGWLMTGIDPEGIDLRAGEATARLDFGDIGAKPVPVMDLDSAERLLVAFRAAAFAARREVPNS